MSENVFRSLFDGIMNAAENAAPERNTFMGEDGFLHCADCGEPVEAPLPEEIVAMFPGKKTRPRMCKCDRENAEAETLKEKQSQARMRIEQLRSEGLYSEAYRQNRFDSDDNRNEKVSRIARNYVDSFDDCEHENIGLMFWGGVGTGKSFYAACIANALIEKYRTVVMTNVQDLVAEMTENYGENREWVLDTVGNVDLLILDDLGVERSTGFMNENVFTILNKRCDAKKPMIITSNLNPAIFESEQDMDKKRTYDRIKEMCTPILVSGESRRTEISKNKKAVLKKILEESQ